MWKKIPDKYKYLFEKPKPLRDCSLEEKAVYAYFDHKAVRREYIRQFAVCVLISIPIAIAIVIIALLI